MYKKHMAVRAKPQVLCLFRKAAKYKIWHLKQKKQKQNIYI
jgi:hypothetical protein